MYNFLKYINDPIHDIKVDGIWLTKSLNNYNI